MHLALRCPFPAVSALYGFVLVYENNIYLSFGLTRLPLFMPRVASVVSVASFRYFRYRRYFRVLLGQYDSVYSDMLFLFDSDDFGITTGTLVKNNACLFEIGSDFI